MEITHLRYFKKTAELEHITKAAQELHVAQPSLSRTISMLEDELKVKLFNRKGKSIELNEYGIIVLNHTNRILKELEAIHREIDDARENSVMNVTFSMNAASTLIPRLVRGFKEEHSDIRLHILQEGPSVNISSATNMANIPHPLRGQPTGFRPLLHYPYRRGDPPGAAGHQSAGPLRFPHPRSGLQGGVHLSAKGQKSPQHHRCLL